MKIHHASRIVEELLSHVEKSSEVKALQSLLEALNSLNERDLSADQIHLIEGALDEILFHENGGRDVKRLKRSSQGFMKYLREDFKLVPAGFYTELGVALGLCFGVALGAAFQGAFDRSLSIVMGIAIGMTIGAAFGTMKDSEAARENRVLQYKSSV